MMGTNPRFNVIKGNTFEMVSSLTFDVEVQQQMALIEWINSAVPHLYLSVKASDEEFRASLLDGDIFSHILQKLKYSFSDEEDDSSSSAEFRRRKVQRFIAAMSELGLPTFEITDLEKGSMRPVMDCLLALKEHTRRQFGTPVYKTMGDRRPALSEIKFERSYSPLSPESPTMLLHGGNKFHEVFQMKQGFYADLPATKISEMIKSNSLDHAPTQSLLSVINMILDESIDRKNAAISQSVACLLRKVVQEIERRIATQAEHLRTQSNVFKAREEKYQSRIKVLDALAKGTSEESEIAMNQLQHMKYERSKTGDKKRSQQQDMEEKKRSEQKQMEEKRFEQAIMDERKRFERMMEEEKKRFEQMMEEKKRFVEQEANKLKRLREETNIEVSMLKQELETAKRMHELRFHELETEAQQLKSELEKKVRQQEQMLEDSKGKMKELELDSQSKSQNWFMKEHIYEKVMSLQMTGLEDLRRSSVFVKQEMLTTQKTYLEELNHVGIKLKNLAKAAQSYHDVLNENRKLYNELQDLKGNIKVFCRVRPFLPGENQKLSIIQEIGEHGELIVANPAGPKDSEKAFRFNKVYGPMASQAEVFADTQPLIRTILDGYNVCIFAYGQTGSGKTFTMSGLDNASKEDWGVNYRALNDLFQVSEGRRNFFLYEIAVQMIEIYNEQIRDLLSNDDSHKKLGILSTPQPHGLTVPDASMHPVRSSEDVIQLMNIGLKHRAVGATAMNERSSRSHSVVTIHVHGKDLKSGATTHGSLHLVDLAGSERVDRSEATGDRLKEAQHINKSLSSLGDVIFALAQKTPHVPYRNSKLTQVLQTSLGGRAKTLMFVQLNPDVSSYSETLSTLKFAERVSGVELGAARNNKEGRDVKEPMEQVASLKDSVSMKNEEIERSLKDPRSPSISSMRSLKTASSCPSNALKVGASSPSARSIGSSPREVLTVSAARRPGILHKSFDSFSDHFDPGFQPAFEDSESEGIRPSRSMNDLKGQKKQPADGSSMDDDMKTMVEGDVDNDDRLSETSDSNFSVATDLSDATTESNISQEQSMATDSPEKRREKLKTSKRHTQSPRAPTGASRLSQGKTTTLREAAAPKRPGKGSSTQVPSASGRRWM